MPSGMSAAAPGSPSSGGSRSTLTSSIRPNAMPMTHAGEQSRADAGIADVAGEQARPPEDAVGPEAAHVRFEREVDHPENRRARIRTPPKLLVNIQSRRSTSADGARRRAKHDGVADHDEQREPRGAAAVGPVDRSCSARAAARRDEQRRRQQRRRPRSADAAAVATRDAAPCGSAATTGRQQHRDGPAAIRRRLDAHLVVGTIGQRPLPRRPRVREIARRPLRRRRRERRHVEARGVEQRLPRGAGGVPSSSALELRWHGVEFHQPPGRCRAGSGHPGHRHRRIARLDTSAGMRRVVARAAGWCDTRSQAADGCPRAARPIATDELVVAIQVGIAGASRNRRPSRRSARCSRATRGSAARGRRAPPAACRAASARRPCVRGETATRITRPITTSATAARPRPTPSASLSPAAASIAATASRRRRAPRPADRRPAARRRPSARTPAAGPDRASRQRRISRSTAGSRSRTIDEGVVSVPVSCSCFRSPSDFAS